MFGLDEPNEQLPIRSRSLDQLGTGIASPEIYAGGGSAAAATASLAAATAELVVRLTHKRRSAAPHAATIGDDLRRLQELRAELLQAGDRDEDALDRLMQSYRSKDTSRTDNLVDAAETSLAIARLASETITIAARQVPLASRFTASDLGAAAALAHGATRAALLTARINIQLLGLNESTATDIQTRLGMDADAIESEATRAADEALSATRVRIEPPGQGYA